MRYLGCTLAATLTLITAAASAGTLRAWTAAKAAMPADTSFVMAVDVAAVSKTATFAKLFPLALAKNAEIKHGLEQLKSTCKLDPVDVVRSVAVALDALQSDAALFVNVTASVTPAKLATCVQQMAGADAKVSVKTEHGVTDIAHGDEHLYVGWIGTDVIVIVPEHMDSKDSLATWMAGGGLGKGALAKVTTKMNAGAAMFGASTISKSFDATHTMAAGYGSASLAKGHLVFDLHADLGDAAGAKSFAADAMTQITELRKNPPLPSIGTLLENVTVTSAASEIVGKADVVDKDFGELIALLLATI